MEATTISLVIVAVICLAAFVMYRSGVRLKLEGPFGIRLELEGSNEPRSGSTGVKIQGAKAGAIARDIGDRSGEGTVLWNLSLVLDGLGERERAIDHAIEALRILEAIEDPRAAKVRAQIAKWRGDSPDRQASPQ